MASYPSNIKTFATLVDMVDSVLAAHQNERGDEITAIETELGTNPKGSAASVKARIEAIEAQFAITAGKVLTLSKNLTSQGGDGTLVFPSSGATLTIPASTGLREILTANRTYYVRTDGDDSHTGLVNSAAGAFLTIQKAVDTIANTLDIAGKTVTIQVGDGTYTGAVILKNVVGYAAAGNLVIQGNSGTPANVVISTTSAECFKADSISTVWDIKDMKLTVATGDYACLYTVNGATIRFGNIDFGSCTGQHIYTRNGRIQCIANYSISGGSNYHWLVNNNGFLFIQGFTITLSGTPAFNTFVCAAQVGMALVNSNTYSGSATGKRYFAELNGVIKSEATLPGNTDGSTQTGGQYV